MVMAEPPGSIGNYELGIMTESLMGEQVEVSFGLFV
jgi:hypothetical protein